MSILEIGERDTVHDVGVDGTGALVAVFDRVDETGDELLLVFVGEVRICLDLGLEFGGVAFEVLQEPIRAIEPAGLNVAVVGIVAAHFCQYLCRRSGKSKRRQRDRRQLLCVFRLDTAKCLVLLFVHDHFRLFLLKRQLCPGTGLQHIERGVFLIQISPCIKFKIGIVRCWIKCAGHEVKPAKYLNLSVNF